MDDELCVVTLGNDNTFDIGVSVKVGDHIYPDYTLSESQMKSFYDMLVKRYEVLGYKERQDIENKREAGNGRETTSNR